MTVNTIKQKLQITFLRRLLLQKFRRNIKNNALIFHPLNKFRTVNLSITNKQDTTSITLDKNVTGNMGDWNKEFTFTVYVNDVELESTYNLTHQTPVVTIPNIPIGATVMIVESNNEGYTVTATVDGNNAVVTDNAIEFEVTSADGHSVVFTNDLNAAIDTGITTNTFPMILLFSTVTVLGAVLLIGKKRYEF